MVRIYVKESWMLEIHNWLVVTGTCMEYCHIEWGIIIPIDFHIFQRGSNHKPGNK